MARLFIVNNNMVDMIIVKTKPDRSEFIFRPCGTRPYKWPLGAKNVQDLTSKVRRLMASKTSKMPSKTS